ncbi:cytochrome P450 [Nonomuraea gerenzanensis]|uniref:Putative cytochrome P450 hydroxylase n=1 Tax=Nonomuraea gerenzanensis TaxID=93944 RepID=A0A1M4E692_9ACTN|nr:cytochrome P450 [Nonomuraea gerenzanensis]UBU16491.1 cytochrome P450 [Nonomuraea gerenzanensis]SBO94313.1 putative cytochrome P450 hydroxylase [Nonomuraea gerenzanensis]
MTEPAMTEPAMIEDFDVGADWHVAAPYPFLAGLREHAPVFKSEHLGAYVLTRYADVRAAYGDPRRFSSQGSLTISRSLTRQTRQKLGEHGSFLSSFVANVDPPDHTRLRRSVSRAFTPRAVAAMEQRFRALNEDLLDRVAPRGRADFVSEIGHEPSIKLTARFIGLPEADEAFVQARVKDWFQLFLSPQPPERQLELADGFLTYLDYVDRLVAARAKEPKDDFTSLMTSLIGEELTHREVVELISTILLGGNDTVPNQLGNTVLRLLREGAWPVPPELVANASEECMRIDGASLGSFRYAAEDIALHGVTIPRGALVLLSTDSAGHDGSVFPDPDRFVIDRPNAAEHLVFGYGIHFCVGAALGRLQLRTALEVLGRRLPGLRLAPGQAVAYRRSIVGRGLTSLLVEW